MEKHQPIEKTILPEIKNIIIVASGKGGVGKSTVAAGLALSLAKEGYATGLFDGDIYGPSVPTLFNLNDVRPPVIEKDGRNRIVPFERFGIKLMSIGFFVEPSQAVLWRGLLVSNSAKQLINDTLWGSLDYLIIDTPPGTGDIHITLLQQFNISGAIIVTTPQEVAIADVQKAIQMYRNEHVGVPVYGIIENMAWFTPANHPSEKYFLFGRGGGQKLSEKFNIPLIAQIPISETICESCDKGNVNEVLNDPIVYAGFETLVNDIISKGVPTLC
jgi:ATP-binding protein involved in chromosome partitioning